MVEMTITSANLGAASISSALEKQRSWGIWYRARAFSTFWGSRSATATTFILSGNSFSIEA